mmetsp:Transcript_1155/g.3581  ORF Transcript_1155/g.3581 Transcript_1155/m.3581 type:complete len:365 (+) Transcript_1155:4169-5263(+)
MPACAYGRARTPDPTTAVMMWPDAVHRLPERLTPSSHTHLLEPLAENPGKKPLARVDLRGVMIEVEGSRIFSLRPSSSYDWLTSGRRSSMDPRGDSSDSSDSSDADNEHEQAEWGDTAAGINESDAASDSDDPHDSYDETGVLETGAHANGAGMSRETNKAGDFEEVPMSEDDSDSAAEEFDMLTDDAKAEVLALAKKFISKKSKSELLESSYNRYSFHENDKDLPGWFREDEKRFRRPAYQVTGAEFNEAKQSLAGINTRTTKKVVEAKARKMRRLQNKLQTARKQAEAVAAHEDLSGASKMRQIEKIYAQARSAGGKKNKLSRSAEYKDRKRRPKLDARLRADKRGLKAAEARNKKKRKGRR